MRASRWFLLLLGLLPVGCSGTMGSDSNGDGRFEQPRDGEHSAVPACPVDPECGIVDNCDYSLCPDYWLCEDLATGVKRCVNPGPQFPDSGDGWVCTDEGGTSVCRRPGTTLPDDGGAGDWNCERQGEFIVCRDGTPTYPGNGGDDVWNCYFSGEFRICEAGGGDGGDWTCYDLPGGGRECRNNSPSYPDDREWECYDQGGDSFCRTPGGTLPDDGGGGDWNCERQGEFVVCQNDNPEYPGEGGGDGWDCRYGDEFRVCTEDDGGTYPGPGSDVCVPGVQRWCDDAVFCSWGKQTCMPDGRWGRCVEPNVSAQTGLSDRPSTECGCRFFYFNYECCEDQQDRDRDGNPDCIIPSNHTPPACPSDGGVCSYCDAQSECGGNGNMCIFRRDGYAFCAQNCANGGTCPAGYDCRPIQTRQGTMSQCVPTAGSCR